jgi:chromosome segregation ATPase
MVIKNIEIDMKELGENYTPRSIQEVENDIKLNLEKLREYYDISEDLVKKKEELENRIQEISSKKIQVTLEIEEAQKAEKKLEDEFFNEFKEKLKIIENDINERFKNASIQKKGRLELKGNIDSLLVDVFVTFAEGEERNLTTLSGGEQTMFSISLMLTLQELNPSPLCIFDECQMFLDMENSQEVSRLIKNAANKGVQFIIILPDAAKTIIPLADHVIGVAKNGENDISTVIEYDPKEYVKKLV